MVRDPYMDQERALGRLIIEYEKHGQLIVAFDFDDTVFNTHERPGWEYNQVIELLRRVQPYAYIICWSASVPERYESMWQYFKENEHYDLKAGEAMKGFVPDWIGEFYAYYQWYYDMPSSEVVKKIPVDFLSKAYYGLHDLDLELAVKKVGEQ